MPRWVQRTRNWLLVWMRRTSGSSNLFSHSWMRSTSILVGTIMTHTVSGKVCKAARVWACCPCGRSSSEDAQGSNSHQTSNRIALLLSHSGWSENHLTNPWMAKQRKQSFTATETVYARSSITHAHRLAKTDLQALLEAQADYMMHQPFLLRWKRVANFSSISQGNTYHRWLTPLVKRKWKEKGSPSPLSVSTLIYW